MYFQNPSKEISHEAEIRAYRRDAFSPSHMITDTGITADKYGRKIVPAGTLVDKDGNACKIAESAITGTPVGITRHAVDVTNGPEPVAVFTRGHLRGPLLNMWGEEYSDTIGKAIEEALPEIHIYPRPAAE